MKGEMWIWSELLAFDSTAPDLGVAAYLAQIGEVPAGISLLTCHDFVLCHDGIAGEKVLPPTVCSRQGHTGNGMRERQPWTDHQIRALVRELQAHGIKVLFSVFEAPTGNVFGPEFCYHNCPEHRYAFVGRLNDGRPAGEFFLEKLARVLRDYGFDGWHAADNVAAPWSILSNPTDHVIREFAETHRELGLPEFLFADDSAPEHDAVRRAKLHYLQKFHWRVWNDFMLDAWREFWRRAIETVHGEKKIVMINSANTKSVFGALQYMSLDYRELAAMGVDYLLVETTSAASELIWRNRHFAHEFDAVLSEMTAAMPGVKVLILPAVRDVVECYDAFDHAPCLFERDLRMQTAQHILRDGALSRCAAGAMVCLGDCLDEYEWRRLRELLDSAFSFDAVRGGELLWLHDSELFDALREDHHRYGTPSPARQITELRNRRSIDISVIADAAELLHVDQPFIALDFHLWRAEKRAAVLAARVPRILTGRFTDDELPAGAETLRWTPPGADWGWCCVFLGWEGLRQGVRDLPRGPRLPPFDDTVPFNLYTEHYPQLEISECFWRAAADRIREVLGATPLANEEAGIQLLRQCDATGAELVQLISHASGYTEPVYRITFPAAVSKIGRFPRVPLDVRNGQVAVADPAGRIPLLLPPMGILSFVIRHAKS